MSIVEAGELGSGGKDAAAVVAEAEVLLVVGDEDFAATMTM